VSVDFDAQGDENGLGFTFVFDPAAFTFAGAAPGSGAGGVNLNFNTNQVGAGQLGVLLALAPRGVFAAGMKELVKVSLVPLSPGLFPLTFTDQLVTRCVSDASANELPVGYLGGSVTVSPLNPLPPLAIARMSNTVVLAWPAWAADFTLQTSAGGAGFSRNWTDATGTVQTSGGQLNLALPISSQAEFFRLRR